MNLYSSYFPINLPFIADAMNMIRFETDEEQTAIKL